MVVVVRRRRPALRGCRRDAVPAARPLPRRRRYDPPLVRRSRDGRPRSMAKALYLPTSLAVVLIVRWVVVVAPRGRRPVPSHGRVPRDVRDLRLAGGAGALRADAASHRAGAHRSRRLCVPVARHRHVGRHVGRDVVRPGAARTDPTVGAGGDPPLHRVRGDPGPLPRRRLPGPERVRVGPGGRRGPARVPVAGARRRRSP